MRRLYNQIHGGITRYSVNALERWMNRGFDPDSIRIYNKGDNGSPFCFVRGNYQGKRAYLKVNGVCWGYNGEGPRGLYKILAAIGKNPERAFTYDIAGGNDYFSLKEYSIVIK